jgi:phosphoglycolate phosphatase
VRPTVLLYDIDGTLISSSGAGRAALVRAFERRFGAGEFLGFRFDGMTDPAIIELGLRAAGIVEGELAAESTAMLAAYLGTLEEACTAAEFRVHAGIEASLALAARPEVAVGLGTGNVARGARLKLERVALHHRFAFGGYGDDSGDRPTLLRIGAARGAARLGRALEDCRVVVIGDTPKDIAAARAIGADCIAVATGSFSVTELRAHAPTLAVPDLTAPGAAEALLDG